MAVAGHVPAWKRLGLKLKNANDIPGLPSVHSVINHIDAVNDVSVLERKVSKVKKGDSELGPEHRPVKKHKTYHEHNQTRESFEAYVPDLDRDTSLGLQNTSRTTRAEPPRVDQTSTAKLHSPKISPDRVTKPIKSSNYSSTLPSVELCDPEASERYSSSPISTPTLIKRKSVSFTPETKTRDGDSTKQLYTTWLMQQGDEFDPTTSAQALRHVSLPKLDLTKCKETAEPGQAAEIKPTKQKPLPSSTTSNSMPILPTLEYLNLYYTKRQVWKFNKSKQNQILKHALNILKIPPEYDAALKSYMEGLGSAGARKRLRDEALRQIKEDAEFTGVANDDENDDAVSSDSDDKSSSDSDISSTGSSSEDEGEGKESESPAQTIAQTGVEEKAGKVAAKDEQDESDIDSDTSSSGSSSEEMVEEESPAQLTGSHEAGAKKKAAKAAAKASRRQNDTNLKKYYRFALRKYKRELKQSILDREERDKIQDPEWRMRLLKRKRAELIIWTIGKDDYAEDGLYQPMPEGGMEEVLKPGKVVYEEPVEAAAGVSADTGKRLKLGIDGAVGKQKRRRIRKRRTGLPDDDSSSEESSSDSDSVISEDEGEKRRGEEADRALGRHLTRELKKMR